MNCFTHCFGKALATLGAIGLWGFVAIAVGIICLWLAYEISRAPLLNEADDLTEASDPYTTALLKNNSIHKSGDTL